ncbi:MAG: SMC-Scp complex subunit ScpB [Gammaproteobacteria bacterium]|jgi:segregation and condensation protein B|nr:SMC-Scp complex subunit ScpB [Gammaproteobacteria bacterium]MDP7455708.1 SMC-Scp complex subunit ScpB [Gammaproteobacteria bacterium]HJO11789.1 SMC-Scp complex subunit ScpB [Gammaproteobacteria bacterium]|tara:strand:- start:102 stop:923 length:822 start_codon:yes stop_codon:yes gene_type:complete
MNDVDNKIKIIIEGLLLAAGKPLNLDGIARIFAEEERPDKAELRTVMESIAEDCKDRGFELKEVASGYRFQVKQELSEWVAKLWDERPPRYTRALLETLSLIAYRQPITRGDIEEIRGVGVSSNIIRTLLDREWVRVVGHRDVPGRPAMFATTRQFLDYFNLKSLQDLPPLSDIKDLGKLNEELDLDDDLAGSRVLELPEDLIDENAFESTTPDELLAEEEAVKLSRRPLDEILDLGNDEDAAESNVVSLTPALDEEDSAIQFSLEEDPDELE